MKASFRLFLATALLLPVLGTGPAQAQVDESVKANVPFDFYAGTRQMPAGTYFFKIDAESSNVLISDQEGHGMFLMRNDIGNSQSDKASLVFEQMGDHYFLKTISAFAMDVDFSVKDAEKKLALNTPATQVVVAANLH